MSVSQSSLLLPQFHPHASTNRRLVSVINHGGPIVDYHYKPITFSGNKLGSLTLSLAAQPPLQQKARTQIFVSPDSKASNRNIESALEETDVVNPDTSGGGDGDEGNDCGGGGGGGGNDRGGGDDDGGDASEEPNKKPSDSKTGKALLMSQKFTLAYAALVGLGGVMGYLKGGSQKSLAAGGLSALLLYFVYTELPKRPVFASSVGLGLSAALLAVMGSRFKRSGKVFPAGVMSLVSLIMTGGYLHGIMRSTH